ncbi:flagellar type III secretion system pore protein FliP [Aquabacterium humicola]|uniref:flagellar type III secretion system pore protein FliP n=1 Tax=Aquabacterium humicola TaxID=3237377 RepID=UPI002542E0D6|nr:flagellar type III secretion system pore protein FliP [Rubrivivax pictus]
MRVPVRLIAWLLAGAPALAVAADRASVQLPGVSVQIGGVGGSEQVSSTLLVALALTVLSLAPSILVCMTSFVRISIVLSMLRHALGLQDTPPNTVLVSLSLFLTAFTMMPVFERVHVEAVQPMMSGRMSIEKGIAAGLQPMREFMLRQTRPEELATMAELSRKEPPADAAETPIMQLIPAFMLSELRIAFQIAFAVFLPFLLIDMLVATLLMALGMMMVPPATLALPMKILLFVLIDGWSLLVRSLLGTIR